MYSSQLKIDTSFGRDKPNGLEPVSSRSRTHSNASSSSSLDIISPRSSSTNASTSSLLDTANTSANSQICPQARALYVLAMHDYSPQHQNATCLSFRAGQVIRVLSQDPSGWWDGQLEGRRGWFPSNYVNADIDPPEEEELTEIPVVSNKSHFVISNILLASNSFS